MTERKLIELKNVSKYYYKKGMITSGISRVDLELRQGEFVVVTGESGSGKSTLLNVISGMDTYEEGELYIDGSPTSHFVEKDLAEYRKRHIGNVFQEFNLVNSYTVYQNVELVLLINGFRRAFVKPRVRGILSRVGMLEHARVKASKLSGGQKQRVAIARALARETEIITCDEPTGNLDSRSAEDIVRLLAEIASEKLVIVVTHNYEQFRDYATRRITMHDGRIVEDIRIRRGRASAPARTRSPETPRDPEKAEGAAAGGGRTGDGREETAAGGRTGAGREGAAAGGSLPEIAGAAGGNPGGRNSSAAGAAGSGRDGNSGRSGRTQQTGRLSVWSRLKLGLRNTFNVAPKFLLLLLVFAFLLTAVTSQYTSYLSQKEEAENLGTNSYFSNLRLDRIVVKKQDGTAFTTGDYDAISTIHNVKGISEYDVLIDAPLYLEDEDYNYVAIPRSVDEWQYDLLLGRMPENAGEILLAASEDETAFREEFLQGNLDREYNVDVGDSGRKIKLKVVGLAYKEQNSSQLADYSEVYMMDETLDQILTETYHSASRITVDIGGRAQTVEPGDTLYDLVASDKVAQGEAVVSAEVNSYYEDNNCRGKKLRIAVENLYGSSSKKLTIRETYAEKTFEALTGYKDYESHDGSIFISREDYEACFASENYQATVYVEDTDQISETKAALEETGYTALPLRETLLLIVSDVLGLIQLPIAIIVVVALFFIAYFVIRLILRSRTGYFSILRMLGMSRKNIRRITDIELITVMSLAFGLFLGAAMLTRYGVVSLPQVEELIKYMEPVNYVILYAGMLLMSWLISGKFTASLFRNSAMGTYREEV